MSYNTLSKVNQQPRKTNVKSPRGPHSYVGTFTRITQTHPGSLQSTYMEDNTAKSRRHDLRGERGNVMISLA